MRISELSCEYRGENTMKDEKGQGLSRGIHREDSGRTRKNVTVSNGGGEMLGR